MGEGLLQLLAGDAGLGRGAHRLQGDDQARERVGKHVVHLACQALSLGEDGGLGLCRAGLLQLSDQELRLFVGADEPAGEDGEPDVGGKRQLVEDDAVEWPLGAEAGGAVLSRPQPRRPQRSPATSGSGTPPPPPAGT